MLQLPVVKKVNVPPVVIAHTLPVLEVKLTDSAELAVAVNVGVVPKFWVPGILKVMVWLTLGVALLDATDAALVPTPLVAVTVKVYAVPLVRPLTMIGLDDPEPVSPLGLEVTV